MSFSASVRLSAGVTLIDIGGWVARSEAGALHDMLHDLLGKGRKNFVLNLKEVQHLDSSGIGELASAYATVKKSGGQLKILHLSSKVRDLFSLTNLYMVFEEYPDEQTAIQSFGKANPAS